jgi:hypothetical protein
MGKLGGLTAALFVAAMSAACAGTNPESREAGFEGGQASLQVTITRSSYGSVSAQTAPRATCTASARLPSGRDSTAQGLDTHSADAAGSITWTYRTVSNTNAGTGTYTVRCTSDGESKSVTASFTVR